MSTGNLNLPSDLHLLDTGSAVGPSPFTAPNAFSGEFLGLPMNEDEPHFWSLSPISPTMGMAWDTKADAAAFAGSALDRDLKNAQVRNGQPTPPPYDDHTHESSSLEYESASKRRRLRESKSAADSLSPDFDDIPPQERAKRAKFLERNRLAASKCRQKKKEHTQKLEYRYKEQSEKKERLQGEIASLRSQILSLKNEVLKHAQCGDEPIKLHLAQMVKRITDSDGPAPAPAPLPPRAPPTLAPTKTPVTSQAATTSNLSFGFDDPLQLEPAAVAAAEAFEQQLRRNSEASLVSESSYTFSPDDTFDDLINV
ncbi:Basic leucine zipper (bZIP) transcription factor atfB [Penicillium atrosanguineum]|nr:Basic leucine zipper (bZIP) transcription factor atfB [Penicillium atrosanguineum]